MKIYIHARLRKEDRTLLDALKKSTAHSESELVRQGLRLIRKEMSSSNCMRSPLHVSVLESKREEQSLPDFLHVLFLESRDQTTQLAFAHCLNMVEIHHAVCR